MSSQLNVDTIVDKAGSGGTNVKIANTSVTVAEGGSATTNTVQGLCKTWAYLNGQGTIALQDSLNNSSPTDHGTGEYTFNFTSNMGNAVYSSKFSGVSHTNTGANGTATSSVRVRVRNNSNINYDSAQVMMGIHGDLA